MMCSIMRLIGSICYMSFVGDEQLSDQHKAEKAEKVQRKLDTVQFFILGSMIYLGIQDTQGLSQWVWGTVPVFILFNFERDPRFLHLIEGLMILLVPLTYFTVSVNVAFGLVIALSLWNGADALHLLTGGFLALKDEVPNLFGSSSGHEPAAKPEEKHVH